MHRLFPKDESMMEVKGIRISRTNNAINGRETDTPVDVARKKFASKTKMLYENQY
jgi:hypothetical protein